MYANITHLIRLPGYIPMPAFQPHQILDVPLVARQARLSRENVRVNLGIPQDTRILLVSLGGHSLFAGASIADKIRSPDSPAPQTTIDDTESPEPNSTTNTETDAPQTTIDDTGNFADYPGTTSADSGMVVSPIIKDTSATTAEKARARPETPSWLDSIQIPAGWIALFAGYDSIPPRACIKSISQADAYLPDLVNASGTYAIFDSCPRARRPCADEMRVRHVQRDCGPPHAVHVRTQTRIL